MIGCIGKDQYGDLCTDRVKQIGIDHKYLWQDARHSTGIATIVVDDSGDNRILLSPGANYQLTADRIDRAMQEIHGATIAVFQLEIPLQSVKHALQKAYSAGIRTVLNPAPAVALSDELLKNVSFLIPNETEAALLTGIVVEDIEDALRAGRILLGRGVREAVIITLGAKGCVTVTDGISEHLPAEVTKAIDTTA